MKKINVQRIDWKQIDKAVTILEKRLKPLQATIKNVYGLPRGGLIPATMLSHRLRVPLVVDQRSISKYTVVVDEIIDSGDAMVKLSKKKKMKLCVSLFLRHGSKFTPDYTAFKIKEKDYLVFPWEVYSKKDIDNYMKTYGATN